MKNSVKRLSVSIFVLFVAVCLVATSAYAWFTMSNNPTTGSFDLTVTTTDGLYISASGIDGTYKTSLTTSEILGVYQAIPQLDAISYSDSAGAADYAFRDIDGTVLGINGGFIQVGTYSQYKVYYEEGEAKEITAYVTAENFSLFKNCNIKLYKGESALDLTEISVVGDVSFGTDKIWTKTSRIAEETANQTYISENIVYQYNAKYYEFNLYFMGNNPYSVYANISDSIVETVGRADITLGVDLWSTTLTKAAYLLAGGEGNITDPIIKAYASDALKIGFWSNNTLQNIWEPDKALTAAEGSNLNNLQEGDYAFSQQSIYKQGGTAGDTNIAINYYNDKNNLTGEAAKDCTGYSFPIANQVTVENAGNNYQSALMKMLTLSQVGTSTIYKGTLSIKIWIDGWDADCFDSIFDQTIRTSLEFFSK